MTCWVHWAKEQPLCMIMMQLFMEYAMIWTIWSWRCTGLFKPFCYWHARRMAKILSTVGLHNDSKWSCDWPSMIQLHKECSQRRGPSEFYKQSDWSQDSNPQASQTIFLADVLQEQEQHLCYGTKVHEGLMINLMSQNQWLSHILSTSLMKEMLKNTMILIWLRSFTLEMIPIQIVIQIMNTITWMKSIQSQGNQCKWNACFV